jgi:predicted lactoylglutathione lyase
VRGRDHLRFLELSVPAQDLRAASEFYASLGFALAEVGETRRYPYAVATDGRLCIGMHGVEDLEPSVSFVRPDLLTHLDRYEALGLSLEVRRLGGDVFNEIGWRDPGGNPVRLVEARTFSPSPTPAASRSACGYFREIALPAGDLAASHAHWERIGFVALDEDGPLGPCTVCTSDTLTLGLYDPRRIQRPTVIFESDDLRRVASALTALGVSVGEDTVGGETVALRCAALEGTPMRILRAD